MTRAEEFKTEAERAAQKKKASGPGKPGRTPAAKLSHNDAPKRTKNSSYELEATASSPPSRKSTRKSLNRQKTDSALRITQTIRNSSAPARAQARRPKG